MALAAWVSAVIVSAIRFTSGCARMSGGLPGEGAALTAFARIGERLLGRALGDPDAL